MFIAGSVSAVLSRTEWEETDAGDIPSAPGTPPTTPMRDGWQPHTSGASAGSVTRTRAAAVLPGRGKPRLLCQVRAADPQPHHPLGDRRRGGAAEPGFGQRGEQLDADRVQHA